MIEIITYYFYFIICSPLLEEKVLVVIVRFIHTYHLHWPETLTVNSPWPVVFHLPDNKPSLSPKIRAGDLEESLSSISITSFAFHHTTFNSLAIPTNSFVEFLKWVSQKRSRKRSVSFWRINHRMYYDTPLCILTTQLTCISFIYIVDGLLKSRAHRNKGQ